MPTAELAQGPRQILERLPEREHAGFLAQYRKAAHAAAEDPDAYPELQKLLHDWSLRAIAVNKPGYYERRAEAKNPPPGTYVPASEVIPDWEERLNSAQ